MLQIQNGIDAVVIDLQIAEIGVMFGLAFGQVNAAYTAGAAFLQFEADSFAIQIMARRNFQVCTQCLPVQRADSELEGLVGLQNPVVGSVVEQAAQAIGGRATGECRGGEQATYQKQGT